MIIVKNFLLNKRMKEIIILILIILMREIIKEKLLDKTLNIKLLYNRKPLDRSKKINQFYRIKNNYFKKSNLQFNPETM
jgi:hypothetical protein